MPTTLYLEYAAQMQEYRLKFEEAVAKFIKEYPKTMQEAKAELGAMFKEADYPHPNLIKGFYSWELTILPFPDARDFRVDVDEKHMVDIKGDLEKQIQATYAKALASTAERITETVQRMSERLKAYKPPKGEKKAEHPFKDSLVENVRELADLLPAFNLTNDKKLTAIIDRVKKELCPTNPDLLREDDKLRKKVAKSADEVLAAVADFIK